MHDIVKGAKKRQAKLQRRAAIAADLQKRGRTLAAVAETRRHDHAFMRDVRAQRRDLHHDRMMGKRRARVGVVATRPDAYKAPGNPAFVRQLVLPLLGVFPGLFRQTRRGWR